MTHRVAIGISSEKRFAMVKLLVENNVKVDDDSFDFAIKSKNFITQRLKARVNLPKLADDDMNMVKLLVRHGANAKRNLLFSVPERMWTNMALTYNVICLTRQIDKRIDLAKAFIDGLRAAHASDDDINYFRNMALLYAVKGTSVNDQSRPSQSHAVI